MGNANEPLNGFSWRSGAKRDTVGIIIWNDVFLHTMDRTGEKIAIFVMDTQGLFDSDSTPTDNSRVFSLGTLTSSIQILNLMNRIQEDQLQYLEFATEYTQLAAMNKKEIKGKPFQSLMFLVRDWINADDFQHGTKGGEEYLREVLQVKPNQKQELRSVRETLFNSFEKINSCLLPHPGKVVTSKKNYDGNWGEMDEDFKIELKSLIEQLLLPENLVFKKVNSKEIIVKEMRHYNQVYFQLFSSNEIPSISTIYESTIESHMNELIKKCIDDYKLELHRNRDFIPNEHILSFHNKIKERALNLYSRENKMGTLIHEEKFKVKLEDKIEETFGFFQNENNVREIEKEKLKLQAALEKEQKQIVEAQEAVRQVELKLKELEDNHEKYKAEEYERYKLLFEERDLADRQKLEAIQKDINEKLSFRENLAYFILALCINPDKNEVLANACNLANIAVPVLSAFSH